MDDNTKGSKGDFRDLPIPIVRLPWTGREDGDDAGYRDVPLAVEAEGNPDPLVVLDSSIQRSIIYAVGATFRICPMYEDGLGAPSMALVREPVNNSLLLANSILRQYGRELLVLDVFRSVETQRRLFAYLFQKLLGTREVMELSLEEYIRLGIRADDIGAYAKVLPSIVFGRYLKVILSDDHRRNEFEKLAPTLNMEAEELAKLYLTFQANLGQIDLELDATAPTAHGGGGAVDAILIDHNTGEPTCLGVPFDYLRPSTDIHLTGPAAMRYFDNASNFFYYRILVSDDPALRNFLEEFSVSNVTPDFFDQIKRERRLFFHSMTRAGFSFYSGECWHWNAGNEHGGYQARQFACAGNACHSLLKNICNADGQPVAVWGNAYAQTKAAEIISKAMKCHKTKLRKE